MQVEKERKWEWNGWVIFYRKCYIQKEKESWGRRWRKKEAPAPLSKENNSWLCLLRRCRLIEARCAVQRINTHTGGLLSLDEALSGLCSHTSSRSWTGLGLHVLNQPRQMRLARIHNISVTLLVSVCCYDPECGGTFALTPLASCNCQHQIQCSDLAVRCDWLWNSILLLYHRSMLSPILWGQWVSCVWWYHHNDTFIYKNLHSLNSTLVELASQLSWYAKTLQPQETGSSASN